MVINISVQYNDGFLPDIILLTQVYYHRGTCLNTMEWLCLYSLCNNSVLLLPCSMVHYIVSVLFLLFFWCPCMAINVTVQYKTSRSTPVAQLAPRNLLTRWDVSSIPANGIFLTKN